jgi:hypothetical protein
MNKIVAGLDLGQRSDYTCLMIAERSEDPKPTYTVRYARRWRGVPYPELVEEIGSILGRFGGSVRLRVDATGVGAAVMDLFGEARARESLKVYSLTPIVFTAGNEANPRKDTVPKKDLIGKLEVLINQGRLSFAGDLKLAGPIKQELKNFQARVSAAGRASFEAAGSGHDDLVIAAALAVHEDGGVLMLTQQDYMDGAGGTGTVDGEFVDWERGWTRLS